MGPVEINELATRIRAGSVRAIARGLTWIEAGGERAEAPAGVNNGYKSPITDHGESALRLRGWQRPAMQ